MIYYEASTYRIHRSFYVNRCRKRKDIFAISSSLSFVCSLPALCFAACLSLCVSPLLCVFFVAFCLLLPLSLALCLSLPLSLSLNLLLYLSFSVSFPRLAFTLRYLCLTLSISPYFRLSLPLSLPFSLYSLFNSFSQTEYICFLW